MIVKEIEKEQALYFVNEHHFELMLNKYWSKKYVYYGVWDDEGLVAIQIVVPNFPGWSYEKGRIDGSCHLVVLQKTEGTAHGVFKTVLDYFSPLYIGKYIYLEVYVDKLRDMYEGLGFVRVFKNNPHMYKKYIEY
jgi:hypothetical protein